MKNVTRRSAFGILCLCLAAAHPLAAEADSPLDAYGRLPALEDWALSPDGTKSLLATNRPRVSCFAAAPSAEARALA